ncbi:MAG: hypothetical protein FWF55_08035 [Treponema sp.]|nr:hypothetical protein [Treponema sp.]
MNKSKFRIISKICLLFVVIGFFLPISCNLNGFQIAKAVETWGGPNILSISLYSIFIFSCIGIILLFALLMKKKFSIGYDWLDLIIIITAFLVFMAIQIQSSDNPFLAIFFRLQSGAYIIFIGLVGSLYYLISATFGNKESNAKMSDNEEKL